MNGGHTATTTAVRMGGRLLERDDHRADALVGQAIKPVLEA